MPEKKPAREIQKNGMTLRDTAYSALVTLAVIVFVACILALFIKPYGAGHRAAPSCIFPSDIDCKIFAINTSGNFALEVGQYTGHAIGVTHLLCTEESNATLRIEELLATPVVIKDSEHAFLTNGTQKCISTSAGVVINATRPAGSLYKGHFIIRYTDLETGLQHTVVGDVAMGYEDKEMAPPTQ